MNEQLIFECVPNRYGERSRTLCVSPTTWNYARRLCSEQGYEPPADSLSGRFNVKHLVATLRKGLERISKAESQVRPTCRRFAIPVEGFQQNRQTPAQFFSLPAARKELLALIDYLECEAAAGFSMRQRYRRATDLS